MNTIVTVTVTSRPRVSVTLSAAAMGSEATEADYDSWAGYVATNIDNALSIDATVEQAAFTGPGAASEDAVTILGPWTAGEDDQRATIRSWLSNEGWEAFCASSTTEDAPEHDLCPTGVAA